MTIQYFVTKNKSDDADLAYLAKITANVQNNMKTASFGANFLYDENIDHTEKKAQNSDFERGQFHGENEVVKFENWNFSFSPLIFTKGI